MRIWIIKETKKITDAAQRQPPHSSQMRPSLQMFCCCCFRFGIEESYWILVGAMKCTQNIQQFKHKHTYKRPLMPFARAFVNAINCLRLSRLSNQRFIIITNQFHTNKQSGESMCNRIFINFSCVLAEEENQFIWNVETKHEKKTQAVENKLTTTFYLMAYRQSGDHIHFHYAQDAAADTRCVHVEAT